MRIRNNEDIRILMFSRSITQKMLADEIGVSLRSVTNWFHEELEGDRLTRVNEALERLTARKVV